MDVGKSAEMIEVEWGSHLIDSLLEFGPSMPGGMGGPVPVSFQEIDSWAKMTRTYVPGYEALLLRSLSQVYCEQYHKSSDPGCPMPREEMDEDVRNKATNDFKQLVKNLKAKK